MNLTTANAALRNDARLPFLALAWSREGMARLLEERFFQPLWPGYAVESLDIKHMNHIPGECCVLLYKVRCAGGGPPALVVATFERDDRNADHYPAHVTDLPADRDDALGVGLYLPDYRCTVEMFPADFNLPELRRVVRGEQLNSLCASLGIMPEETPAGTVKVLKYRPHKRCVLLCTPAGGGLASLIVKVFPHGDPARDALKLMRSLYAQCGALGVRIPRPISQTGDIVFMERLDGGTMKKALELAPLAQARAMVRDAARALAALHEVRVEGSHLRTFEGEVEGVRGRADQLEKAAPEFVADVHRQLDRIAALAPRPYSQVRYVHGDLKPAQILLNGDSLSVVDFDRADVGDPALDVGEFMAHLYKESLTSGRASAQELGDCFLETYRAFSHRDDLERRAMLFRDLSLLRLAVRRYRQAARQAERHERAALPMVLLQEVTGHLNGGQT